MADSGQRSKARREISEETFRHLVDLAALELSAEEAAYLRRELNSQLRAIADLESIALPEGTPITSHGIPYPPQVRPELRADEVEPCPEADEILEQAPERDGRYLVVPDQPATDLE
ncbi:MAG: Asp-tRNA(Asn)/Glu-tRNA(Gln) amidotransferase subunit GatC [Anaerolineales bacterium]